MSEDVEIWKDVLGWEEKYKVSNLGRVWNKIRDVEVAQVMTGIPQYKYVNLTHKGEKKLRRVHTLIAHAFIENDDPENKKFVDHIDRDKFNNNLDNLRWATNSDNQRNLDSSLYINNEHIKDFVLRYDNPEAAHQYIYSRLREGFVENEALAQYEEFLKYGLTRDKIEYEGVDYYIVDLTNQYRVDYDHFRLRIRQGWGVWNALMNIPEKHHYSFEVNDKSGVGHWYKTNEIFEKYHPECFGVYRRLIAEGRTLEDVLAYDGRDHLRHTIRGFTGTIQELCKYFDKTESNVTTRMGKGMTMEQALTTPPERVKKVKIDGVSGSPKYSRKPC